MVPPQGTTAATVATSPIATSEGESEEKEESDKRQRAHLAPNGRYVTLEQSGLRSEKGVGNREKVTLAVPPNDKNSANTRTLYDLPKDPSTTPRPEAYRRAHPSEISKPTEFAAYLRDAGPATDKQVRVRFNLPTVEESMETLQALYHTKDTKVK
jgi:hypothetical protein